MQSFSASSCSVNFAASWYPARGFVESLRKYRHLCACFVIGGFAQEKPFPQKKLAQLTPHKTLNPDPTFQGRLPSKALFQERQGLQQKRRRARRAHSVEALSVLGDAQTRVAAAKRPKRFGFAVLGEVERRGEVKKNKKHDIGCFGGFLFLNGFGCFGNLKGGYKSLKT